MSIRRRHLWWLLVSALAVLVSVGLQYAEFHRQQTAIKQIETFGGRVVTTHGEPAWVRWLIGGRSSRLFNQATVVNLSQTNIHDNDLLFLDRLNGLERLNLSGTAVTDDGLRHLRGLTGLKALDLGGTRITGGGLKHLHRLTALEYLYVSGTNVTDADLRHLKGLRRLRHLDISGTAVTGDGLAEVKRHLPEADLVR